MKYHQQYHRNNPNATKHIQHHFYFRSCIEEHYPFSFSRHVRSCSIVYTLPQIYDWHTIRYKYDSETKSFPQDAPFEPSVPKVQSHTEKDRSRHVRQQQGYGQISYPFHRSAFVSFPPRPRAAVFLLPKRTGIHLHCYDSRN